MNGWEIAGYTAATVIALGLIAWGVSVAWWVSGARHIIRGEYEIDDYEDEDI